MFESFLATGNLDEGSVVGLWAVLFYLFIFIPYLSVTVRRLHDTGHSGWIILLYAIPFLGFYIDVCG